MLLRGATVVLWCDCSVLFTASLPLKGIWFTTGFSNGIGYICPKIRPTCPRWRCRTLGGFGAHPVFGFCPGVSAPPPMLNVCTPHRLCDPEAGQRGSLFVPKVLLLETTQTQLSSWQNRNTNGDVALKNSGGGQPPVKKVKE